MLSNVSLLLSLFEQKTSQTTNSLKENEKIGNICIIREMSSLNKCLNYFFHCLQEGQTSRLKWYLEMNFSLKLFSFSSLNLGMFISLSMTYSAIFLSGGSTGDVYFISYEVKKKKKKNLILSTSCS